ncbi:MAG: hypothetical protein KatS3mg111_0213 [Pirellulaceae bacterium]|nr:MAG: hypothetical protein KatS3mg111_0213 [Pirellulaceae bacterium]
MSSLLTTPNTNQRWSGRKASGSPTRAGALLAMFGSRHRGNWWARGLGWVLGWACIFFGVLVAQAQTETSPLAEDISTATLVHPDDTVWEFSTRCHPETCQVMESRLAVRRMIGCRWETTTYEDLLQDLTNTSLDSSAAGGPRTIVYVHGNWTEDTVARSRGLLVYQRMREFDPPAMRFIIYSWPSARDHGVIKDIYAKAARLDFEAFVLATLLRQLPASQSVGLIGFSFGGAITAGALHLDAGGSWGPYRLSGKPPERRVHVTWLAPAFDRDALRPNGEFELALRQCDRVVNYYNSCDPVLKRFRLIDPQTRPEAAGFAGLPLGRTVTGRFPLASNRDIEQFNCCCTIGRTHSEESYLRCLCHHPRGLIHLTLP